MKIEGEFYIDGDGIPHIRYKTELWVAKTLLNKTFYCTLIKDSLTGGNDTPDELLLATLILSLRDIE